MDEILTVENKVNLITVYRGEKGDPGIGSGDPTLINTHNNSPTSHADLRFKIADLEPYVHIQSTMATDWIVNHGKGRAVSVDIYDSQGRQGLGTVITNGDRSLVITLAKPMTGYANVN